MKRKNPYGDGRDRIAKVTIALFIIFVIACLSAGSYKPLIYKIFNDYEEECFIYEMIEKTTRQCYGDLFNFTFNNVTQEMCWAMDGGLGWKTISGWKNITTLEPTDNCLKYHLVRKNGGTN